MKTISQKEILPEELHEILTNMGVVCHFLGLSKKRSLIIDPTWRVDRNLGRIKVGSLFPVMKRHLEKLEQKKE